MASLKSFGQFKGTHTVYFSSSLYIINQKPMIPRTFKSRINSKGYHSLVPWPRLNFLEMV